ncbi:hypothetical protein [Nitrobacter hamburgensis]|uniref:hypothetical protein n=1 Tax=Nitrobacter hamburgensis TaxID=912 RepID=UPI000307BE60|nr:hypothetical protein [Nitrobacter hamburgensis]
MAETYLPKTEYNRLAETLLSAAPIPNIEPCLFADVAKDEMRAALGKRHDVWLETVDPNKVSEWVSKIEGRAKQ